MKNIDDWYKHKFKYTINFLERLKNNSQLEIRKSAPQELLEIGIFYPSDISKNPSDNCYSLENLIDWLEVFIDYRHTPIKYSDFPEFEVIKNNKVYKVRLTHLKKTGYVNTRKNANESSNFYELLTAYYILHGKNIIEDTGIIYWDSINKCESEMKYSQIEKIYNSNNSSLEDSIIAWKNAEIIKKDLGFEVDKIFWTANHYKPNNIHRRNPSDIIILLKNGKYKGYSLKKVDKEFYVNPIINTGLVCFWKKDYVDFSNLIIEMLKKNFDFLLEKYSVEKPNEYVYTEKGMVTYFINFPNHKEITLEYRRLVKNDIVSFLSKIENLVIFMKKIRYRLYGDSDFSECPYKLVYSDVEKSSLVDINENTLTHKILSEANENNVSSILINNKYEHQGFDISFECLGYNVCFKNIVIRTRFGGLRGLDLYITFSNLEIK